MRVMSMNKPETFQIILGCLGSFGNGISRSMWALLLVEILNVSGVYTVIPAENNHNGGGQI